MKVIIQDELKKFEIEQGDIFIEPISKDAYILNKTNELYYLMILDGTGEIYNESGFSNQAIKERICRGEMIHYPKDTYQLELWKNEGE